MNRLVAVLVFFSLFPVKVETLAMFSVPHSILDAVFGIDPAFLKQPGFRNRLSSNPSSKKKNNTFLSPAFEITDNDEKFQVAMDMPGILANEVDISINKNTNLLTVSGKLESKNKGYSFVSQFSQSFRLDPTVNAEQFKASLEGGVLTISAPKDLENANSSILKIPVTTSDADNNKNERGSSLQNAFNMDQEISDTTPKNALNCDEETGNHVERKHRPIFDEEKAIFETITC